MINFRFHLASLIAVFLALAVGIVMGSTVVKEATVKGLRAEIRRVERSSNARQRDNTQLRKQLSDVQAYVRGSVPHIVLGSLSGVTVGVVAVRGVDGDVARNMATLVQQAGGSTAGVLWLEDNWSLKNADDARKLAEMIGEPTAPVKQVRDDALTLLGARLGAAAAGVGPSPAATTTPTTAIPASGGAANGRDILADLVSGGFATFEAVGTRTGQTPGISAFPGTGARMLLVTSTDASADQQALLPPLAHILADARTPAAFASVYREQRGKPARGSGVSAVRDDTTLSKQVSTVDDLELMEGQVAAVLALGDLGRRVGHYGYGDGATAVMPAVAAP
jgi:hypothetical protein